MLAAGLMTLAAAAQNKPSQTAEKKDPLYFVKIAADVAGNVQPQSLNGFLAVYIDPPTWASGLKDGDLGKFLKLQEGKPGRSAACLFSDAKDVGVCVFFDGDTAFGVAAAKAAAGNALQDKDVASAFKTVSKEMLKKGDKELHFEPGEAATDDGAPLPAFAVTVPVKFSN